MKTFYALIARGKSYKFENGGGFNGMNDFVQTEAENQVQAFLQIYRELKEETSDITALKTDFQDYMLGFSADEWNEISKESDIRIREGYPENEGIQIQAIRDTPFN